MLNLKITISRKYRRQIFDQELAEWLRRCLFRFLALIQWVAKKIDILKSNKSVHSFLFGHSEVKFLVHIVKYLTFTIQCALQTTRDKNIFRFRHDIHGYKAVDQALYRSYILLSREDNVIFLFNHGLCADLIYWKQRKLRHLHVG